MTRWVFGVSLAVSVTFARHAHADGTLFPSVVGGTTVAPGVDVVDFAVGHSELGSIGWRHGVTPALELGLVFGPTLGYHGLLFTGGGSESGAALGAVARARFKARVAHFGIASVAISFEPGLSYMTWTPAFGTRNHAYAFELPVNVRLGLAFTKSTTLGFIVELPFFLELRSGPRPMALQPLSPYAYGPKYGLGFEHAFNESFMFFMHLRTGMPLTFTIDGQVGLSWRLPSWRSVRAP